MPKPDARPLADRPARRTARYALRSCRVYAASTNWRLLALQNKEVIYGLLFRCSAQTLIEIAAGPEAISAPRSASSASSTPGIRSCKHHPHVHRCVVAAGGLSRDHAHWNCAPENDRFFLPVGGSQRSLPRQVSRSAAQQAHASGQLQFHGLLRGLAQPRLFREFDPSASTRRAGWSTAVNRLSVDPSRYFVTSAPTLIALRFPTTVSFPSLRTR